MAKCKTLPLQPSPVSKTNIKNLETSLRHYAASTASSFSISSIAQQWPPRSLGDGLSTKRDHDGHKAKATETIAIESDSESVLSVASSGDEAEVWADAFEYQEQMLLQPRLSQVSIEDDKENIDTSPSSGATHDKSLVLVPIEQSKQKPNVPHIDVFARRTRQYEDIPKPPQHKPLQQEDYFSMQNNPTAASGRPPAVMYITNENQLNSLISLLRGPILSLDLEWLAWEPKKNISLIQISDASTVLLIQICKFAKFPVKLKEIIESPKWIKTGVSIMGADMSRLRDVYNVWAQGVCELSFFARLIDREAHGPKNTLISLSNLAKHYLGSPLAKGPVRCSDWTRTPLSPEQRHYAAIDAYAGYLIFAELERLRQSKAEFENIWPPISACPPRKPDVTKGSTAPKQVTPPKTAAMAEIRQVLQKFSTNDNDEAQAEAQSFRRPWKRPVRRSPAVLPDTN